MINIDAKVKDSNGQICRVEGVYDDEILVSYGGSHAEDSDFLKHGTYTVIEDIRSDLEQQKQRADELEDRISEEIRKRFQLEDRWRKAYERADELEKRWNELKQTLLLYKNVPQKTQSFDTVFELMKEMELEKENE